MDTTSGSAGVLLKVTAGSFKNCLDCLVEEVWQAVLEMIKFSESQAEVSRFARGISAVSRETSTDMHLDCRGGRLSFRACSDSVRHRSSIHNRFPFFGLRGA